MSAREPFVPRAPVLVAGEGVDECNFVETLCKHHRISGIQAFPYDGRDSFPLFLEVARPQFAAVRVLVVLRDADADAKGAFESVTGSLARARLPVPTVHGSFADGAPSTAIWILPDDQRSGTLETTCWDALVEHAERPCVERFLDCVEKVRGKPAADPFKAPIRAWLATCDRAETRVGLAASRGSLPLDAGAFGALVKFLRVAARRAGAAA